MDSVALPEALPIHKDQRDNFHDLRECYISSELSTIEKQYEKTINQLTTYIDLLEEDQILQCVNKLTESYKDTLAQKEQADQLDNQLESLKQDYLRISDHSPATDIDSFREYTNGTVSIDSFQKYFTEGIVDQKPTIPRNNVRRKPNTYEKLLKALPYIIRDPTCVIPDEDQEEDDIQIEGGKIELNCPITCKPFENPMISKACNHVFDKVGIQMYFDTPDKKKCPQGACGHELTARDFIPDNIMMLRCKINNRKKNDQARNMLDVL